MQGIFPKEYFVYFEGKCRNRTESSPLSGHVDGFQMDPLSKGVKIRGTTLFRRIHVIARAKPVAIPW